MYMIMPIEKQKKILIIEDEKPLARALEVKLQSLDFQISIVFDGKEACDILLKERFDLILLDLILPKLDGFYILKKMKDQKITTPVIVLSNLSQKEDIEKAQKLGAHIYLGKADHTLATIANEVKKTLEHAEKL